MQLFAERATEARPGFRLDDRSLAPVAEICRRLDGLPLAIEMAAARMRSIGVEALAARLDQRFSLLAGQRASVDPRHRNLHSLVQWSYELLDPVDQEAFTNLSVFAGSFDLDAADAVCGAAGRAARRRSAARRDRPGRQIDGAAGGPRRAPLPPPRDVA